MSDEQPPKWWVIREDNILAALRAVQNGQDADLVMLDLLAHTEPGDDSDV